MTTLPRLGKPALRALAAIGVTTLEDVAKHSREQLLALHGFGPKGITILEPALTERGLAFQPDAKHP